MLKGIDGVAWHSLTHAYGSSSDVPSQIRGLASPDKSVREKALHDLYGNIWHQGSVYEATAYAIPFLVELLDCDHVQGKNDILVLLAQLATGHSYHDVHQNISFLTDLARTPEWQGHIRQELGWVKNAKDAVIQGMPVYRRMLVYPETSVRDASTYLLAALGEASREAAADLMRRLSEEDDEVVKASLVRALGIVGEQDAEVRKHILELLSGKYPKTLQLASAMALTGIMRSGVYPNAIAVLLDAIQHSDEYALLEHSCWQDGDTIAASVSRFLATLEGAAAESAEEALIQALASEKPLGALTIAEALLQLTFQEPMDPGTKMSALTARQQRVMRAFAANRHLWGVEVSGTFMVNANTSLLMRSYNLPRSLESSQAFVGQE